MSGGSIGVAKRLHSPLVGGANGFSIEQSKTDGLGFVVGG